MHMQHIDERMVVDGLYGDFGSVPNLTLRRISSSVFRVVVYVEVGPEAP